MKTVDRKIGMGVRITLGMIFILAGTMILTFGQTKCDVQDKEAELENIFNEIQVIKIKNEMLASSFILPVEYKEIMTGEELESKADVEKWMLDNSHFTVSVETSKDEVVRLEAWMTDYNYNYAEVEETPKVEGWMLDKSHFENNSEEELMQVEPWMLESSAW